MHMLEKQSVIKYHEQLPPQHNLAEEILLGGVLLNSQIIKITVGELTTESFATETHRLIYATIIKIYFQNNYVDSIILINTLWDLGLLAQIGGINKVLNLLRQAQIFVSNNIKEDTIHYYINLVKDKYIRRLLIQYGYDLITLAHISSVKYPTIFFKAEKYLAKIKLLVSDSKNNSINTLIASLLLNLKSHNKKNNLLASMSGFSSLDRLINGFTNGDLIVVAGRPSMGKTSFSLNIAFNILSKGPYGVKIFSLEMSKEQIVYKLLSIVSSISISSIRSGKVNKNEWTKLQNAGNQLINSCIEIDDTANLSISQLALKAKALYSQNSTMNLLIIDYLQLIQLENISLSNRTEELSLITRSLKILAKELNVPIIVLSQLNRNVENRINKRPLLADLRESGCVVQKTYIIGQRPKGMSCIKPSKLLKNIINSEIYSEHLLCKKTYPLIQKIKASSSQYIYSIIDNSSHLIQFTHNHSILCIYQWQRSDNLKYFSMLSRVKMSNTIPGKMLYSLTRIQLLNKNYLHDVIMYEEKNFIANDGLVLHNSIEQDADLVLLLYRESYYNENIENNNLTDVIVAKHRNGPIGTAQLYFKPKTSIFTNV